MKNSGLQLLLLAQLLFCPVTEANAEPLQVLFHEFAPHSYLSQSGKAQGVLVELVEQVCKEWTGPCEVAIRPNRRAQFLFDTGEVPARFLAWNPDRAKNMWFSVPLVQTEYGFFSLKSYTITELSQLAKSTVGVYGPSNTARSLNLQKQKLLDAKQLPFNTEVYVRGNELPLKMLQKKRFHAYYANREGGYFYAAKIGLKDLNFFSADRQVYYSIAFNKAYVPHQTVRQFNQLFAAMLLQGKFDAIYAKWHAKPAYLDPAVYQEMSIPY
ncbi:transporter substrate-binding domain-containing protein [Shewanella insulae]|uniref:substrate-binding periplasmic protein n=1 Tax=Shewanella insulae TaxID=2681496 RepID=UPI001EFD3E2D|nr:transporter substrate-binding domain-containing protein [Shewanella insulae]MCG9740135.1 transporter substrate-binding domain-containing protein [Shewanella insulae]